MAYLLENESDLIGKRFVPPRYPVTRPTVSKTDPVMRPNPGLFEIVTTYVAARRF